MAQEKMNKDVVFPTKLGKFKLPTIKPGKKNNYG